jgi:hypothetical protein
MNVSSKFFAASWLAKAMSNAPDGRNPVCIHFVSIAPGNVNNPLGIVHTAPNMTRSCRISLQFVESPKSISLSAVSLVEGAGSRCWYLRVWIPRQAWGSREVFKLLTPELDLFRRLVRVYKAVATLTHHG